MDSIKNTTYVYKDNKNIQEFNNKDNNLPPFAQEFHFNLDKNKYSLYLKGGRVGIAVGLKYWASKFNDKGGPETLNNFAFFHELNRDDKFGFFESFGFNLRKRLLPIDDTPLSDFYREFGAMKFDAKTFAMYGGFYPSCSYPVSQFRINNGYFYAYDGCGHERRFSYEATAQAYRLYPQYYHLSCCGSVSDLAGTYLAAVAYELQKNWSAIKGSSPHEKILNALREYYCFSFYPIYYLTREKFSVEFSIDGKKALLKIASPIYNQSTVKISQFKDGYTQKLLEKCVESYVSEYGSSVVAEIDAELFDTYSPVMDKDYIVERIDTTQYKKLPYKITDKPYRFINKTNRWMIVEKPNGETKSIAPYGIYFFETDNLNVRAYYPIRVFPLEIKGTESLRTLVSNQIKYYDGFYVRANNFTRNPDEPTISSNQNTKYSYQLGPILTNNASFDKNNKQYSIRTNKATYYITWKNNDLFYKKTDELDYKKASLTQINGTYYWVTDEDDKLGELAFMLNNDEINYHPDLIYQREYTVKDNKTIEIITDVINPYGFTLYSQWNVPSQMRVDENLPMTNIKHTLSPYEVADVSVYDRTTLRALNAISGEYEDIYNIDSFTIPGLMYVGKSNVGKSNVGKSDVGFLAMGVYKTNECIDFLGQSIVGKSENATIVWYKLYSKNPTMEYVVFFIDNGEVSINKSLGRYSWGSRYRNSLTEDINPQYSNTAMVWYVYDGKTITSKTIRNFNTGNGNREFNGEYKIVDEILPNVKPIPLAFAESSKVREYIYTSGWVHSKLLNTDIYKLDEIGLAFKVTPDMDLLGNKTSTFIKDKNKRSVKFNIGNTTIEATISGEYKKQKTINIKVSVENNVVYDKDYDLAYLYFDGGKNEYMKPRNFTISKDNMVFIPERFFKYLLENNVFLNVLVDFDENNGVIDDSRVKIEAVEENEGVSLRATLGNIELDIINIPMAVYYYYRKDLPIYGRMVLIYTKEFINSPVDFTHPTESFYRRDLINQISKQKGEVSELAGYELYSYLNVFEPLKVLYNTKFLGDDKGYSIGIPKEMKVAIDVYCGYGNKITFSHEFNSIDNIYKRIYSPVSKCYLDKDAFIVEYYKVLTTTLLKRSINVDMKEQTFMFSDAYNNAKTQLIQDLREDTVEKRVDGAYVDVEFDTQNIYNTIHTLSAKVWNIPEKFECDSSQKEAEVNEVAIQEPLEGKEITYNDVFNSNGMRTVYIDSPTDITLSIYSDNNIFEAQNRCNYKINSLKEAIENNDLLITNVAKPYTKNINGES